MGELATTQVETIDCDYELRLLEGCCKSRARTGINQPVTASWRQWYALLLRDGHLYPIGTTDRGMKCCGVLVVPPVWEDAQEHRRKSLDGQRGKTSTWTSADELLRKAGCPELAKAKWEPRYRPADGHRRPGRSR